MTDVVNSVNVDDVPLDQPHLRNLYRLAKKRTEIDAEIVQAMIDAWREGGTLNDIAVPFGLSDPGVKKILNRNGVDTARRLSKGDES